MSEEGRAAGERKVAVVLFVLALVPRLLHLLLVRDSPLFNILFIDLLMYDEWGLRIAGGELLSDRPFFLDPLYPYFLGGIYAIFGHSYVAVVAVQSLLGALAAPLVFLAALRWFDRRSAVLAGGIAALYIPGIYFGSLIMKPGLSIFFSALLLWLLSHALSRRCGPSLWVVAGVVFGAACLTRGNLLLVLPVLVAWLLLARGAEIGGAARPATLHARVTDRRRLIEIGSLVGGTALVLLLPALHNYAVGGEFILTTANAGANFYIGNNPTNDSGEYQQLPFIRANPKYEQIDFAREAERRAGREMSDRELSGFWFREAGGWIRDDPLAWLGLMWSKLRSFWGAYEIPDSLDYLLYAEYAPVLQVPLPGFGLLAPLGLTGAVLAARRRGWPQLLLVFTLTYSATVILFFVFSRFRMVIAPALYVLAAFGALELGRRWRGCREGAGAMRAALGATALFFALFAFANLPVRARTDSLGYRVAAAIGLPTRPETSMQGHFNLGLAYAREAKTAEDESEAVRFLALAEEKLRLAIELRGEPEFATNHVELGKVLARQGRNADALEVYAQAARIEPNDFQIHHAMGILHRREGNLQSATEAYSRALELQPRHVASATRLGQVLLELGRYPEAAQIFTHALRVDPQNAAAAEGLRRASAGG